MSYPTTDTSTIALRSNATADGVTFVVPRIEGFESITQKYGDERGWDERGAAPWQTLSPKDASKVTEDLMSSRNFEPLLLGTTAFFGKGDRLAAILVTLPNDITVGKLMETYEDAMKHYEIAYKLVNVPPKGTPGLLFLAPGETGEVVNEITDPDLPF